MEDPRGGAWEGGGGKWEGVPIKVHADWEAASIHHHKEFRKIEKRIPSTYFFSLLLIPFTF